MKIIFQHCSQFWKLQVARGGRKYNVKILKTKIMWTHLIHVTAYFAIKKRSWIKRRNQPGLLVSSHAYLVRTCVCNNRPSLASYRGQYLIWRKKKRRTVPGWIWSLEVGKKFQVSIKKSSIHTWPWSFPVLILWRYMGPFRPDEAKLFVLFFAHCFLVGFSL